MLLQKLEQELNAKKLNSIYVLYGEEKYLLENTVNKIKKIFGTLQEGINYASLDETNVNNIIAEIETPSFGFDKKLVIVKKSGFLSKESKSKNQNTISKKLAEYVEKNFEIINQSVVIVIIEEKVEKCTLLDVLKKLEEKNNVAICEFQKLKLNEIVLRLKKVCALYNVQIDENVLAYLVEISGTSMQNLMNEIRKLIEYVGNDGKITKEDVKLLATQEIDNIIFNLTDSMGIKDTKKALDTLKDLIYLKESLQGIMINLYRHFKKLYFIKLAEKERNNTNIAELLDLKPNQMFLMTKYKKQASYFSEEELRIFLRRMLELEEKYKTGNIDLEIGLEVLVVGTGNEE